MSHGDGSVRDAASEALGALVKFMGEPQMTKLMGDLDNIKLGKIKEFAEKTELSGKPASAMMPAAAAAKKPASGAKVVKPKGRPAAVKAQKSQEEPETEEDFRLDQPKQAPPKAVKSGMGQTRKTSAKAAPKLNLR